MVFLDEKGQPLSSPVLTAWFGIASWGALAVGLLLVMYAIRIYFSPELNAHGEATDSGKKRYLLGSSRLWLVLNAVLIALSVWTGYAEKNPSAKTGSGPDLIFYAAIIIVIPVFALSTIYFYPGQDLRRPKWDRFPLNWLGDPLQALFISTLCTLGLVVGSLFRFFQSGMIATQTLFVHTCLFVGLILGQQIIRLLYRNRIR